jgi:RHH-type proline utilization regulon transcriptional repressor/proline dehydrogenase/delta 1-pyrroline-5-carboxylate dehydrogenase
MTTPALEPKRPLIDWDALDAGKYRDETETVRDLLAAAPLTAVDRAAVGAVAEALVRGARRSVRRQGVVENFLQEFSLSTREGLALMCLAEALLRTPDEETKDRLIAEKIGSADWASHLGKSGSLFVNASTWGLMLTGRLIDVDEEAKRDLGGFLKRMTARLGEPGHPHHGGAVRAGPHHRGGHRPRQGRRRHLQLRHAGRRRPHRRRRRAL